MEEKEKIDFLLRKIKLLEDQIQSLKLQVDLIFDRVYDCTNEYETNL